MTDFGRDSNARDEGGSGLTNDTGGAVGENPDIFGEQQDFMDALDEHREGNDGQSLWDKLKENQQAALGLVFNNIPTSGGRRDLIVQISQATGIDTATLNQAAGQSMRFANRTANTAATQTRDQNLQNLGINNPGQKIERLEAAGVTKNTAQKLAALAAAGIENPVAAVERLVAQGVTNPVNRLLNQAENAAIRTTSRQLLNGVTPGTTYTTAGGRRVTAAEVARNAARNIVAGEPLTRTQTRLIRDNQVRTGAAAILRSVDPGAVFTTSDGRTRTAAQVAEDGLALAA